MNWEQQCYKIIYKDLLNFVKSKGIKVVHIRNMPKETWGEFFPTSTLIRIDDKLNYKDKICTLCHEWMHYSDYKRGLFKYYFNNDTFTLKQIKMAEISASKKAQKFLLKRYGIKFEFDELTKSGIILLSVQWIKSYNL